jgi:UDP-N-acetylglucosamine acyltransferase
MNQPLAYVHPEIAKNVVIEPLQLFITMLSLVMELGLVQMYHNGRRKNRKNCNIFPGAVISAVPQDLKFGGEDSLAMVTMYNTW